MEQSSTKSIPRGQRSPAVITIVSALRPSKEVGSIMRCFPIWPGCSIVTRNGRWLGKTDRVFIKNTERGYSQLDKEALAVIFAGKKFHQFLLGRHFIIYTDHKPLLGLLNPGKSTPLTASGRMQRWAWTLLTYEYELIYRRGRGNGNADTLSRLPLPNVPQSTPVLGDFINLMENINTRVDALKVKQWTARDPVLSQLTQFVLQGWPPVVQDPQFQPYFTRRNELSA